MKSLAAILRRVLRYGLHGIAIYFFLITPVSALQVARDGDRKTALFILVSGWILALIFHMVARFVRPGALARFGPPPPPAATDCRRVATEGEVVVELELDDSPLRLGQTFRVNVQVNLWEKVKEARLALQCVETSTYTLGPSGVAKESSRIVSDEPRDLSSEACEFEFEIPVVAPPTTIHWRPPWSKNRSDDSLIAISDTVVWRFVVFLEMKDGWTHKLELDPIYVEPALFPGATWKRPEIPAIPDNPDVLIELDPALGEDALTWALGGRISGRLILKSPRRRRARRMKLELLWLSCWADGSDVPGSCAVGGNRVADFVVNVPALPPNHHFEAPFSFEIPDQAPISYVGSYIQYLWALRVRATADWLFGTVRAIRGIRVGPRNLFDETDE